MITVSQIHPARVLREAAATVEQRGIERDTGGGEQPQERSMARTVAAFNALTGRDLSEREGWLFMQILKASRAIASAANCRYNEDDYLDGAAYVALASEAAAAEAHLHNQAQARVQQ